MDITQLSAEQLEHLFGEEKKVALRPRSGVRFLLIQGDIIDCASRPYNLTYTFIDDTKDFQVAVGWINEVGEREIVGIVAEAFPCADAIRWRISSELDGYSRMIGVIGRMSEFIRERLRVYWSKNRFYDLCQLPQPIIVVGEK